jgi:hypothetical protein
VVVKDLALRPELHPIFPAFCVPLCDGIVEVYERICCCRRIWIPDILDRLREILDIIPIPLPDPIPWPWPDPGPWPGPGPDPGPYRGMGLGQMASARAPSFGAERLSPLTGGIRQQATRLRARIARRIPEAATAPTERLYNDYVALASLHPAQAEAYVLARPYLLGLICTCSQWKVGEIPLQPGGYFEFCYRTLRGLKVYGTTCHRTFAFKVRQRINGSWVTVYDGVAAHDYFAEDENADLRSWDWRANICGSGPGDPPPTDGPLPFVMLEYVGSQGTHHFNFPAQTAMSQVGPLAGNSGTYTTGYAPDCPWGSSLGLRLWVHPDMQPIATYYRLSVVPVSDSGIPTGAPTILDGTVAWQRYVFVGGDWVTTSESLNAIPATVGGQLGLIRIPYWSGGNFWLSSQYHQVWHTPLSLDGRYLLVLELFDGTGARIKPNSAPAAEPGAARAFQFRRWRFGDPSSTDNVPFSDASHVFWADNTKVVGDIADVRQDHTPSTAECQFLSGAGSSEISIGFRAYHVHGVLDPTNTFMASYSLTWQRGLNGPSGWFASGTADVGESGVQESNPQTISQLLGAYPPHFPAHTRCTFSVHLHVVAKHFTGSGRIDWYDYHETASFAVSLP